MIYMFLTNNPSSGGVGGGGVGGGGDINSSNLSCLILFFKSHQQSFSYKGTSLPELNQY